MLFRHNAFRLGTRPVFLFVSQSGPKITFSQIEHVIVNENKILKFLTETKSEVFLAHSFKLYHGTGPRPLNIINYKYMFNLTTKQIQFLNYQ